jgi:alpha,alpha-trehalose phosphorylase
MAGLGHHDTSGKFRIRGVTRSDAYFALVDDNPCVNMMTQQNLHDAVDSRTRRSAVAHRFGANDEVPSIGAIASIT